MKFASITKLAFLAAALAGVGAALFFGCSNSSSPGTSYPLLLTTVSDSIIYDYGHFKFRVTKNGNPVDGASLRQTDFPSNWAFDLGMKSDSAGDFPTANVVISDTLTGVAYQAVLNDSLSSNYIRWSP